MSETSARGRLGPDDPVMAILSRSLDRQAEAMEAAGAATAAEVRSMNNRLTFIMVIMMVLNTAVVVGSVSLDLGPAALKVDGVDAANAVIDQVESGTLPEAIVYPPPVDTPAPYPSLFDEFPEPAPSPVRRPEPTARPGPVPHPPAPLPPSPAPYVLPHATPREP